MTQPQPDTPIVTSTGDLISGAHRFSHEAMAASFEILIANDDARYAEQAAQAAFDELDRLESELSRFVENSNIARINNLAAGRPLVIGQAAFESLQLCASLYTETNGAFDITIGLLLDCLLNRDKTIRTASKEELNFACRRTGEHLIKLDEHRHTVQLSASPVRIDLGGFGKGYAVDKMAELLCDWSIDTALIHSAGSSVLALGAPAGTKGWPITLSNPNNRKQTLARLYLKNYALSGSGLRKGRHIIDPRTAEPVEGKLAAWVRTPDAATADALSTAFMVMSPDEVEQYCSNHPDTLALIVTEQHGKEPQKEKILHFGPWKELLI